MDLETWDVRLDRIHLAQVTDRWRALKNIVFETFLPQKAGNVD
jgi:hypothetical protein